LRERGPIIWGGGVSPGGRSARFAAGLALAAVVAALDQISKLAVLDLFEGTPRAVEVTSFFRLVHVENRGISFGLFNDAPALGPWILSALAVAITVGLTIWLVRADRWWLVLALGLIIGGAIGNTVDRLAKGAVTDFLLVHYREYTFPAFNLADSAITLGVVVLCLDALFGRRESPIT